jgi:lipopolysaccharide heptosyltransferase II
MSKPDSYKRILVTRMKFIGDVVLTTPVIRSLRNAFPDAYIAYMADAQAASLLEHNPCLNEIIPFDFNKATWREQPRVAALLWRRHFDLAIDLFGNPRSALLTFLSGATTRVGLDRPGRGKLYTVRVQDEPARKTAIDFHMQFLKAIGIPRTAERTEIFVTEHERTAARARLATAAPGSSPVVCLHAGATWPAKRWAPERFASLATLLRERFRVRTVLTAGPGDLDVVSQLQAALPDALPLFAGLPLRELAALLVQCNVCVANDCGTMHIAAAVGTPTIGIFGPGEEDIWFPYSPADGHVTLRHDVACHPCHLDFCNRSDAGYMECMNGLTVEKVAAAVERALAVGTRPPS